MAKTNAPSAPARYFKLGENASVFYDTASKLKVTKTCPGKLTSLMNRFTSEHLGSGHLVSISETEYNEMMDQHAKNIAAQHVATAEKTALRLSAKKGAKAAAAAYAAAAYDAYDDAYDAAYAAAAAAPDAEEEDEEEEEAPAPAPTPKPSRKVTPKKKDDDDDDDDE